MFHTIKLKETLLVNIAILRCFGTSVGTDGQKLDPGSTGFTFTLKLYNLTFKVVQKMVNLWAVISDSDGYLSLHHSWNPHLEKGKTGK
jgi:hypothetical protein